MACDYRRVDEASGNAVAAAGDIVVTGDIRAQVQITARPGDSARVVDLRLPNDEFLSIGPIDVGLSIAADSLTDKTEVIDANIAVAVDQDLKLTTCVGELRIATDGEPVSIVRYCGSSGQ